MNLLSKILLLSLSSTVVIAKSNDRKTTNTRRPNILFVINDDQSHIHTSFAGSHFVNTPGFDKVATNGIYFTNCYPGELTDSFPLTYGKAGILHLPGRCLLFQCKKKAVAK